MTAAQFGCLVQMMPEDMPGLEEMARFGIAWLLVEMRREPADDREDLAELSRWAEEDHREIEVEAEQQRLADLKRMLRGQA